MVATKEVTQGYVDRQDVSLKEYFEMRIAALEKAVDVATVALERRLNLLNESRDTIGDISARNVTKEAFEAFKARVTDDIDSLNMTRAELRGKANQSQVNIAMMFSVLGLIIGAMGIVIGIISLAVNLFHLS